MIEFVCGRDPVLSADDDRRRIQIIKRHFRDIFRKIVQEGTALAGVACEQDFSRFLNGFDDLLIVERHQGTCIDDFGGNTVFFFEDFCGLERFIQRNADGKNGDILSFFFDIGLADLNLIAFLRNAALMEFLSLVINSLAFKARRS